MFVNTDKSPKTKRNEILCKHLKRTVCTKAPGNIDITHKKIDNVLYHTLDWVELAYIDTKARDEYTVYWNKDKAKELKLDTDAAVEELREGGRSAPNRTTTSEI